MVIWMVYATLVSALVAGAAALLERALRARPVPLRAIWAGAVILSLAIPAVGWSLAGSSTTGAEGFLGSPEVGSAPAAGLMEARAERLDWAVVLGRLDPVARISWPAASLLLVLAFAGSAFRLGRSSRRWRLTRLDGVRVRVSHSVGPALVGVLRPEVVLPSWVLDLDPGDRALVLRHEREHLRARDPLLVLGGFLAVVAVPWNPLLWWQFARLRSAVETDCDRRVLEGRAWSDRRRYGELLFHVGERMAAGAHRSALAAFAERGTSLERRIRVMFDVTQLLSPKRLVIWIVAGVGLAVTATMLPRPAREAPAEVSAPASEVRVIPVEGDLDAPPPPARTEGPVFTPYTVGPEITNRAEAQRALAEAYPPLLRDAGIGGTVRVWFHIDVEGRVTDTRLMESSGSPALDEAALKVADIMRFSPAYNRDQPAPVWVQFPIVFTNR